MQESENELLGPDEEGYKCDEGFYVSNSVIQDYVCDSSVFRKDATLFLSESPLHYIIPKCYMECEIVYPDVNFLHEETLFYIFYNCPGDIIQYHAFKELLKKQYSFHTKMMVFFTFNGEKIADNTIKKILYFDYDRWSKEESFVRFDSYFVSHIVE